jgi:triosephosphate isomerase
MNRSMIVANWKMHLNTQQASIYMHRLNKLVPTHRSIEVVIAPSLVTLQPLSLEIDHRKFKLASQNAYYADEGPYTGEVSFTMLKDLVDYAIVGHSIRRISFNETLEVVRDKVAASVRNGITPILCIGESKPERVSGKTKQVIHDQLTTAISNLTGEEVRTLVIAYEPVWAISTFEGEVAKPDEIQKELDYIRYQISELFGVEIAKKVRLLYGGSVDKHNVASYLALDGCDGALVGGASLNYSEFAEIINKAYIVKHSS